MINMQLKKKNSNLTMNTNLRSADIKDYKTGCIA